MEQPSADSATSVPSEDDALSKSTISTASEATNFAMFVNATCVDGKKGKATYWVQAS